MYVRKTDDSPAVRLGDGHALALSPDGKWALSTPNTTPAQLVLLPTGAGQPRAIKTGPFAHVLRAAWLARGERIVLAANMPDRAPRLYTQPAAGGDPRPITPEGVGSDWAVSPDGSRVAVADPDRRLLLYSVDGGDPRPIRGAEPGDAPIRFSPDGRHLYVLVRDERSRSNIHRLELATGTRELWRDVTPEDSVGLLGVPRVFLSADGQSYVYTFVRLLDELYLVDGLR